MKHIKKSICMILSILVAVSCVFTIPVFASDSRSSELEKNESEQVTLTTSTEVFLDRLVSKSAFSVNDFLSITDSNNDFASMSRFAIADWAFANSLITEAQMIEAYCDLLNTKNFENAICLDCFYNKIESFANMHLISATLATKLNSVLEQRSAISNYSDQMQNTRTDSDTLVASGMMLHDQTSQLQSSEMERVMTIAEDFRYIFEGIGFDFPSMSQMPVDYIIALASGGSSSACITDPLDDTQVGNTCLSVTTLYITVDSDGYITTSNNVLRQRLAHGMFHAIQNGYNCIDDWFREACANWGAWAVTGLSNYSDIDYYINAGCGLTEEAILIPATIDFYYGGVPTIVEIYEQLSSIDDTFEAIEAALSARGYNVDFDDVYEEMTMNLIYPNSNYSDLSSVLHNDAVEDSIAYSVGTDFVEDRIEGYGSVYYSFVAQGGSSNYTIEFDVVLDGNGPGVVYQYWYNSEGDVCIQEFNVGATGSVSFTQPDSEEGNLINYVVIIVMSLGSTFDFYIDYTVTQN